MTYLLKTYVMKTYSDEFDEKDRTIVFSRTMGTGNRVVLIVNSEMEEITDFIVDMCDEMGWSFVSTIQPDVNKMTFQIFVKN